MNTIDNEILAYTAGLFDAEGSCGIYFYERNNRLQMRTRVIITNKFYPVLVEIKDFFNYGSILKTETDTIEQIGEKSYHFKGICWRYCITNRIDIKDFLTKIYPFLIIKKQKVREILEKLDAEIPKEDKLEEYIFPYCAGFIDGDGSIYLGKRPKSIYFGKELRGPYFRCNIIFCNNDKEILEKFQSMLKLKKYRFYKHGNTWYLQIQSKFQIKRLLEKILPYLKIKKLNAILLWKLFYNQINIDKALELKEKIKKIDFSDMPELKLGIVTTKGERNPNAKLTNQQAKEIREKYATGKYSLRQLAEEYNVSINTIRRIIKNESYVFAAGSEIKFE